MTCATPVPRSSPVLQNLQKSLNSVLSFSFFITKDMKTDLQHEQLKGTLPIFYVFLARAGKTITDISFITLDKSGQPHPAGQTRKRKGLTPGVRITFVGARSGAPQTLYYFTTDLSNEGIRTQPGFMKFCAAHSAAASLLKSASYLMFEDGFRPFANFSSPTARRSCRTIPGFRYATFDPAKWAAAFLRHYPGRSISSRQYFQPNLQTLYNARSIPARWVSESAIAGARANRP